MLQFLKVLAFSIITQYNFAYMKGDSMAKRIYHLTIEFDPDTEEVEYILETIDEVDEGHVKLVQIGTVDLEKYFDKETLKEILSCYEVGEA